MVNLDKPLVVIKEGRAVTTSQDVAEAFGRRHFDVMTDIDRLCRDADMHDENLRDVYFQWVSVPHPTVPRRTMRVCEMTRDGFTLLAMGYTGPKALGFKLAYAGTSIIGILSAIGDPASKGRGKW